MEFCPHFGQFVRTVHKLWQICHWHSISCKILPHFDVRSISVAWKLKGFQIFFSNKYFSHDHILDNSNIYINKCGQKQILPKYCCFKAVTKFTTVSRDKGWRTPENIVCGSICNMFILVVGFLKTEVLLMFLVSIPAAWLFPK